MLKAPRTLLPISEVSPRNSVLCRAGDLLASKWRIDLWYFLRFPPEWPGDADQRAEQTSSKSRARNKQKTLE
jgi:hypothetical protein